MSGALIDDKLSLELERSAEEIRARRYDELGREAIEWLALVPDWSDELARACRFPYDGDILEFVTRAREAGLCDVRRLRGRGGRRATHFAMPASERENVMRAAQARDRRRLRDTAATIAERILRASRSQTVSRGLLHWAELAQVGGEAMQVEGEFLTRRILEAVGDNDTRDALDWISAGEGLAPVLGAEVEWAVSRGTRRVNLGYRRRLDDRLLERFVARREAIAVVAEILLGSGDAWALHLIGMGGAGKTMLVRHIATRFASDHGVPPFPVGRVDFDHIDPRFPWQRPAQLLVELADALAVHIETPEQQQLLEEFVEDVRRADEERPTVTTETRVEALWTHAFDDAVGSFTAFLASLPRPVVLVLDTCEELAKLHPAGRVVPSVDALFGILEGIQERARLLTRELAVVRVILAGRRLLAVEGNGWHYDKETRQPPALTSLEARPYLRLFEVRGFDATEAAELIRPAGDPDPDVVKAILSQSKETGRVPGVPGGRDGAAEDRFNPFDLSLYTEWLRERPGLRPKEIASGETDAYVEARIIERIRDDGIVAALPAAVLLERFDLAMLAPVLEGDDEERAQLMAVLAEQEWIDLAEGDEPHDMVLAIEPNLLRRLSAYYHHEDRLSEVRDAARALGPDLVKLLLEEPLTELAIQRVDAALRLLEREPREALWLDLEDRVARSGEWEWAIGACERLLSDDEATGEPRHPRMRAPIAATRLAALLHRRPGAIDPSDWADINRWAHSERHDAEMEQWLATRSTFGGIAAGRPVTAPLLKKLRRTLRRGLDGFAERSREQIATAGLAALDAVLADPKSDEAIRKLGIDAVDGWVAEIEARNASPPTVAFARRVLARALAASSRPADAASAFERAESAAVWLESPAPQRWLDWRPPDSSLHRLRLEWLLAMPKGGMSKTRRAWLNDAARDLSGVDADRLASVLVLDGLAAGMLPDRVLDALEPQVQLLAHTCPAHRRSPALFVAVARARVAAGRPDLAIDLLRRVEEHATARRGRDSVTATAAVVARFEMLGALRRMRLGGRGAEGGKRAYDALLQRLVTSATAPELQAAARAAGVLAGGPSPARSRGFADPRMIHARWQAHPAIGRLDRQLAADVVDLAIRPPAAVRGDPILMADLLLDAAEAYRLLEPSSVYLPAKEAAAQISRTKAALPGALQRAQAARHEPSAGSIMERGPWAAHADPTRVLLRAWALGLGRAPGRSGSSALPPRLLAELALEEGELLALRLPEQAMLLLDLASELFRATADDVAAFIASTAGTIASFRAADTDLAATRLSGVVGPAWHRLSEQVVKPQADEPPLPSWPPTLDGAEALLEGGTSVWSGWLMRMAACVQWAAGHSSPATATVPAELWPPQTRPATSRPAPGPALPTAGSPPVEPVRKPPPSPPRRETGDMPASTAPAATPRSPPRKDAPPPPSYEPARVAPPIVRPRSSRPPSSSLPEPVRAERRPWRPFAAALGVLLLAVGVAAAATFATVEVIGAVLALSAALAGALAIRGRTAECEIWAVRGASGRSLAGSSAPVAARIMLRTYVRLPGWRRDLKVKSVSERVDGGRRDWLHAPSGPVSKRLRGRWLPGAWRVSLRIEPALTLWPWEARVLPTPRAGRLLPHLDLWRVSPARNRSQGRRLEDLKDAVVTFAPENWMLLLEDGWAGIRGRDIAEAGELLADLRPWQRSRIVHIMGTPVQTAGGWRLRVDGEPSRSGDVRSAAEESQMLVPPERLAQLDAGTLILQAVPGPPNARDAEGLRALADAVLAVGTPVVLTIPALPAEAALRVVRTTARRLRRNRSGMRHHLRLARRVRVAVARNLPSDSTEDTRAAARATALDVCLFIPEQGS